jgi:dienelactone hydrolase
MKCFLTLLLLTVPFTAWGCPEGQEEHSRSGECVPMSGSLGNTLSGTKSASQSSDWPAAKRLALVEPYFRIFKPTGEPPFPTILYFHGASDNAWHPEQEETIRRIVGEGYAVVFVDAFAGRGISGAGARGPGGLYPFEAAGDVMVAVDWANQQSWIDGDRIALWGRSFGAATIMDALTLSASDRMPLKMSEKPAIGLDTVKAIVLQSPFCMKDVFVVRVLASWKENFSVKVPIQVILPGADRYAPVCRKILERNKANDMPIDIITYKGAGHTFTQPTDDYGNGFPDYDKEKAEDAWLQKIAFLRRSGL